MENNHYEHIIIGAGPAGIQMAYFLEYYGKDYIVLEKSSEIISFFHQYPRHRRLISVNKVNCGGNDRHKNIENILRYDWNSFLTEGQDKGTLLMQDFSTEYYPSADALCQYAKAFVNKFNIQILFNASVLNVTKDAHNESLFKLIVHIPQTSNDATTTVNFTCKYLFIASGLQPKMLHNYTPPSNKEFYYYHNMPIDSTVYKNKRVSIIGGGNAAFEAANFINEHCDTLSICGAERFAWKTHYPGGIRSANMKIIDSYYLKLKVNLDWTLSTYARYDEKYQHYIDNLKSGHIWENNDIVIHCGGFKPSLPKMDPSLNIAYDQNFFPKLNMYFESQTCKNLYFLGCLTQSHDYKHGTSAFIHGFRYNCKYLFDVLNRSVPIIKPNNLRTLCDIIMSQLNKSSLLLHRFDYFSDLILFTQTNTIIYIKHIPLSVIESPSIFRNFLKKTKIKDMPKYIIQVYLGYDYTNKFNDTFAQPQTGQPVRVRESVFIHPILKLHWIDDINTQIQEIYDFHLPENAFNTFIGYNYHFSLLISYLNMILYSLNFKTTQDQLVKALKCYEFTIQHRYLYHSEVFSFREYVDA